MQNDPNDGPNPSGLCMCGCGAATPRATYHRPRRGYVKGQHVRFISGHNARGNKPSAETRAKISLALTGRTGAESPNWRGGIHELRGRKKVYVGRDHEMADQGGYVFEYRLVAAAALGRMLAVEEHVHHIDLNETNNAPENLVVVTSSQHRRIHWRIRKGSDPIDAVREVLQ